VPKFFLSFAVHDQLIGCLVDEDQSQDLQMPASQWSVSLATDTVLQELDATAMSSMTVIPFEHDRTLSRASETSQTSAMAENKYNLLGGILLLSNESFSGTRELAQVCAGLIAQLQGCEQDSAASPIFEQELLHHKLEAMAEFAAGAGHEVNNPLGTITGRVALLLRTESDPERRRMLQTIGGQAHRIGDMIGDAMTFARPPEPIKVECDMASVVREVTAQLTRDLPNEMVVEMQIESDSLVAHIDPEQFRVVVASLLRNSIEAIEESGSISLHLARNAANSTVQFAVEDSGRAMSDIEREHLFDPFFSGREAGRGLGFGLSKCWQILRMHGGTIEVGGHTNSSRTRIVTTWPSDTSATTSN
jgi:signal transduction histidine kinase